MIMLSWKFLLKKGGSLGWFTLILAACTGAGGVESLPTPEPTAVSASDLAEKVDAGPTRIPADKYADLEIVTLLPRDAIPAIDDPQFLSSSAADDFYDPNELVLGVVFDEDARAYSVPFLSNHEIVNDTVGGVKIAVTW
jgi:hypothetical protein